MKLDENSRGGKLDGPCGPQQPQVNRLACRRRLFIVALIFLTALGVRLLNWHGNRNEVSAVQTNVVLNYKHQARLIHANGLASLYDASSSTSNPDLLGHPLGYPILLSFIYRVAHESDTATQLMQMILDSLSAVIICLIAFELFPAAVGVIAGLMAAFAPQFSWNSILLLPDSLAALPILLAMLLMTRTRKRARRPRLLSMLAAGALIGVSCWLRANALLLAPFMALLFPIICKRSERLRPALVLIGGACLVIAPLTIRNALVFGEFIPVSLGAGQTLIEGIADYNTDGTLGLPQTDMELISGEAKTFQRPDYANSLFTPDGPARDRARLARGFAVIRAHPFWFFGVMVRRAISMLRLERTPLRLATTHSGAWQQLFQRPLLAIQKLFITAIFLPLVLMGAGILISSRQFQSLAILLVVPFYYFCTHQLCILNIVTCWSSTIFFSRWRRLVSTLSAAKWRQPGRLQDSSRWSEHSADHRKAFGKRQHPGNGARKNCYQPSKRVFPEQLPLIEYGSSDVVRKVRRHGLIKYKGRQYRICSAFSGLPVALRQTTTDGLLEVFFCQLKIGALDLRLPELS